MVEAIGDGVLDGLDGPEIAAVFSSLVYETAGPGTGRAAGVADRCRESGVEQPGGHLQEDP